MSVKLAELLKLPCLEDATIEAGSSGLNNIVSSISVLEYSMPNEVQQLFFEKNRVFLGGELVITAFASIKDDINAQCESIKRMDHSGDSGLIIYYVGIILPELSDQLIRTANELNFPLICMPKHRFDLRYSEVIGEVMETIINDQRKQTYFVGEMLERMAKMNDEQRNIKNVLRMLSDRIHCSLILIDNYNHLLDYAAWPMSASKFIHEIHPFFKHEQKDKRDSLIRLSSGKNYYRQNIYIQSEQKTLLRLLILSEKKINLEQSEQASEIIRLFINIWNNKEKYVGSQELIRAIIKDEPIKLHRLADIMHTDVASFHNMWLFINVDKTFDDQFLLSDLQACFRREKLPYVADRFEGHVVAFFANLQFTDQLSSFTESFVDRLTSRTGNIKLFVQTGLNNTTMVRNVYLQLKKYIEPLLNIYPRKIILTEKELKFVVQCTDVVAKGEAKSSAILKPIMPLIKNDQSHTLIDTLSVYLLDTTMNVAKTASILFVHPNTVKYRLKKIEDLLHDPIQKLPEIIWIYTAVAVRRIVKK